MKWIFGFQDAQERVVEDWLTERDCEHLNEQNRESFLRRQRRQESYLSEGFDKAINKAIEAWKIQEDSAALSPDGESPCKILTIKLQFYYSEQLQECSYCLKHDATEEDILGAVEMAIKKAERYKSKKIQEDNARLNARHQSNEFDNRERHWRWSHYRSQCWNCLAPIDSTKDSQCPRCEFFICSHCGACMCGMAVAQGDFV